MKLLHTADLHIMSPFRGLEGAAASARREEQFDTLEQLVRLARRHAVEIMLICGDLFDSPIVPPSVARRTGEILAGAEIPVFIAPGNHDYYNLHSPYHLADWPDNVYIFKSSSPEMVPLPGATIYGAAFTDSAQLRSLLAVPLPEGEGVKIMALHGEIAPSEGRYNPLTEEEIRRTGLSYLALGHKHRSTGLRLTGNVHYAHCGCPEGRGFDELGQKGCYLVEVEPDRVEAVFLPTGGRRYEILTVELTGEDDPLEAILAALPEDTKDDIYRILLTGRHNEPPAPEILEHALADYFYQVDVRVKLREGGALWADAGEDSLPHLFLKLLLDRFEETEDMEQRALLERAAVLGRTALEGEEVPQLW